MTRRQHLQYCYEVAFYPPRLQDLWYQIKNGRAPDSPELRDILDTAYLLHQALPDSGYSSQRALQRLALYQAKARAFGTVCFLRALRARVGCKQLALDHVPGHLVRDIGLPELSHHFTNRAQPPG
jgi:hypothetical protein